MVPHLPDDNNVRVLSEGMFQGLGHRKSIIPQLPLDNLGIDIAMRIFNRVLQGQDMARLVDIDILDDGGLGRGFAAADRTGDDNQASFQFGEFLINIRQLQFVDAGNHGGQDAQCQAQLSPLLGGAAA